MKKILALILLSLSFSCFADCETSPPTTSPAFCQKFKEIAFCHCKVDGGNRIPCDSINRIYDLMVATYGSQQRGCEYAYKHGSPARPASVAQCMKDWDCYRLGAGQCYSKCM